MTKKWEIEWHEKNVSLNNPLFIEGLPGIANVGKIAVDFLVDELKAKKLCSFYSHSFPHSVFVNEENLVEMPKIEIYYRKFKDKKRRDVLLLTGDVQPIDEESCYSFSEEIMHLCKKFGCKELITTGGIGLQEVPEKPKVFCTANDASYLKQFQKKTLGVDTEIFGVVGPIMGASGILVGMSSRHRIKAAALLAETFGNQMYLGIKGSKEIVRVLDKKFSMKVNLGKMGKEIVQIEKEVLKKTKEWFDEMTSEQGQAGAKLLDDGQNYIG